MQMLTVKEIAKKWNLSERRVAVLCKEGRVSGAVREQRRWLIPSDAEKPMDNRIATKTRTRKALPIGISEFRKATSQFYYVDKTMMIKELIDEGAAVSLFTRPRRFGKTLNMDMLRVFFEISQENTAQYFSDKLIWKCGESYRKQQGKYPVIFLTFKDIKYSSWNETAQAICKLISMEFIRHIELETSPQLNEYEKQQFTAIAQNQASAMDYQMSLQLLSLLLSKHYKEKVVIIIDEYDIPIQQGYLCGFYDEVVYFIRNLFSGGLKDNQYLNFGFLTGVLRVAKESIFSGLNNIKVNSVLDSKYSEYFGFTSVEVRAMAEYYGVPEKYQEICEWYDGYRFGESDIFNPWSVINYFNNNCKPKAFWQSTGSNDIIGEVLVNADEDIFKKLNALLQGKSFLTYIDTGVVYPQIQNSPSSIYSFLLVAGYLKAVKTDAEFSGDYMCEVAIPNKEIAFVYSKEILAKLTDIIPPSTSISIQEAMYLNDTDKLQSYLRELLLKSASFNDTANESFYHGLVLGLCAMFDNRYFVTSNREAGEGRYDIQLMPKEDKLSGILIEIKATKECDEQKLENLAQTALQQINSRNYDIEFKAHGIKSVLKYGVAFCGKKVEIALTNEKY